jgi:hypothetical protein
MKYTGRVKKNRQKWNHIDTLITRKHFKEDKKVDINIMKEEDGMLVNIHGTRHHRNHYSKRYYQRPITTTNLRSYNKNTWNQRKKNYATTRDQGLRPEIIHFGWIDHLQWNEESRNISKSYYLVSSHVKHDLA